jgi:glutathione S-transferase
MTDMSGAPIKLFQFPRMFAVPNVSPFCCKLETWLRMAEIPYEVVDVRDPRKAPRGKLPFIEDGDVRIADSSVIIEHLSRTRGIDLDAHLDATQRSTALLVQRTLEEHYAFVLAYTHLVRDEGARHTRARFAAVPALVRPFVVRAVEKSVSTLLWHQGLTRGSHEEIVRSAIRDWRAVLSFMSDGPFFFGAQPSNVDATVFATLATTVLTPIDTPIRAFLLGEPKAVAYTERMRLRFFPELATAASEKTPSVAARAEAGA